MQPPSAPQYARQTSAHHHEGSHSFECRSDFSRIVLTRPGCRGRGRWPKTWQVQGEPLWPSRMRGKISAASAPAVKRDEPRMGPDPNFSATRELVPTVVSMTIRPQECPNRWRNAGPVPVGLSSHPEPAPLASQSASQCPCWLLVEDRFDRRETLPRFGSWWRPHR
jgi:hypothetical protein